VDQRPERAAVGVGPSTSRDAKTAVDQRPERAAVEVGPSTSRDAKTAGTDGPGPSKRPRHEGPKNPSSIYRGVTFHKLRGSWEARVYNKGKGHYLGYYKDEEMAAKAVDKAVIKLRGKDAETNFKAEVYDEEMRSMGASEMSVEDFICELRRKAKEDKPKRAKTGYLLFADHMRDRVKEGLTATLAEGEKLRGRGDIVSAIAALWSKQDKETKDEWQARAKERRDAVDQRPERAAVGVGPSTSRDAKAAGADGPGPSKRPRHEEEGRPSRGSQHREEIGS